MQAEADLREGVAKRARSRLGDAFVAAYTAEHLASFDARAFLDETAAARPVCLFCVEREPAACHRSLLAAALERAGATVQHLTAVNVLVVARTRMRGDRVCVGGLEVDTGRSLRLLGATGENLHEDHPIRPAEVWDLTYRDHSNPTAPHVEDVIVSHGRRLSTVTDMLHGAAGDRRAMARIGRFAIRRPLTDEREWEGVRRAATATPDGQRGLLGERVPAHDVARAGRPRTAILVPRGRTGDVGPVRRDGTARRGRSPPARSSGSPSPGGGRSREGRRSGATSRSLGASCRRSLRGAPGPTGFVVPRRQLVDST